MKPRSWIRRNWLWAGGGAFLSVHLVTWLLQRAMKSSAHSEAALRQKPKARSGLSVDEQD
uniref:Transmembrane protein n=1 Tax=Scophthalmus maximus TaxID=52904 RepID=A0A8D3BQE3_SCOMX